MTKGNYNTTATAALTTASTTNNNKPKCIAVEQKKSVES